MPLHTVSDTVPIKFQDQSFIKCRGTDIFETRCLCRVKFPIHQGPGHQISKSRGPECAVGYKATLESREERVVDLSRAA